MRSVQIIGPAGLALLLSACGGGGDYRDTDVPMESVSQLDVERYAGTWYEIARFPNSFEEDCAGVTAEYSIRDDGKITVVNTCRKGGLQGEVDRAEGVARIVAPGQLKVKFVKWLPFEGDYWVLDVSEGYDLAVVGTPSGDFGWILARSPQIDEAAKDRAREVLRADGYDVDQLHWTEQGT